MALGKGHMGQFAMEIMPLPGSLLGGNQHFGTLVDSGLEVYYGAPLVADLLNAWKDHDLSWRVDQAGWFEAPDHKVSFVQSDGKVHGESAECQIVLANPLSGRDLIGGTFTEWQLQVAARAIGNPAIIFAISAALAGPLLRLSGLNTAGFNFFGTSGVGKSLLLKIASSCGDAPQAVTTWSAAQTALRSLSAHSHDGLLTLDGFPSDPDSGHLKALRAISEDAGFGRIISDRDPDGANLWRRILLSCSELPLTTILQRKKREIPAALRSRIVDIPAHLGKFGVFDTLHDFPDPTSFARSLEKTLQQHHGHLLPAFLEALQAHLAPITSNLAECIPARARELHAAYPALAPQISERLALIEFAGELAINLGVLTWPSMTVRHAVETIAGKIFIGNELTGMDAVGARSRINEFIEHNADRILDLKKTQSEQSHAEAVGWQDSDHVYLRGDPMRDQLEDLDALMDFLNDDTILLPGGEARSLQYKMPAKKVAHRPRVYRFDKHKL